jgi:hypothetical protein
MIIFQHSSRDYGIIMSPHIGILFGNSFINVSMYLNRIVSVDKWAKSLNLCGAVLIVFVFTEWGT